MKHIITLLAITIASFILSSKVYGQTSYGNYVMFPDTGLVGSMWKPRMNFCNTDGETILVIRSVAPDTYYSFSDDSRVLLRFADSTVVKLPIIPWLDVQKDFKIQHYSSSSYVDNYITYSFFEIDEDTLNKILIDKTPIIKVRIAYANGTVRDYEIKKSYQYRFIQNLCESHQKAIDENLIRQTNESDENF